MAKITYTNKVALNENPEIADINKVKDDDMNEIKSVVNTNDDNLGDLTTLTTTTKTSTVAAINELDSVKAEDDIIEISNTQPSSSSNKLWIDTGEVQNSGSELPMVYPVGSIYMSVNNTNPATLFGFGTWEQIKDTFLLSAGDTYTAGATGGEATHTLTTQEIPPHNHYLASNTPSGSANSISVLSVNQGQDTNISQRISSSTGGGQAHNNMPPYLVVYMWKRTA